MKEIQHVVNIGSKETSMEAQQQSMALIIVWYLKEN